MRRGREPDDVADRPWELPRRSQLRIEALQLRPRRQVAVEEEVGRLLEGRLFGEVVDRISAITQPPAFPSMKVQAERSK